MSDFVDKKRYVNYYKNADGDCEESDSLIKIVLYDDKRKKTEYYVKKYENGPNMHLPVNPKNGDTAFNNHQTFIWKKVSPMFYQAYLEYIEGKTKNYSRIVNLFLSEHYV